MVAQAFFFSMSTTEVYMRYSVSEDFLPLPLPSDSVGSSGFHTMKVFKHFKELQCRM